LIAPPERPAIVQRLAWRAFWALFLRDLTVVRRELPFFLVRTTIQPVLYTLVFGYLLPRMNFVGRDYTSTLLPGILALTLALSSMQWVALPLVMDFATNGIEDRLLAPVSMRLIASERILMGIVQGLIAALFVLPIARLIMGPIEAFTVTNVAEIAAVALLGAAAFSSLGLLLGTAISPQQIGLVFSVIIGPIMFFGCTYYPWKGLDALPVLKYLVLINPMVYVSEGMRGALTPALPHMGLSVVIAALSLITIGVFALGLKAFERRAIL
jgi:ABC-2 type transport system permease protein